MLPPLAFRPILKPRAWGGRRLAAFGKALPDGVRIGESWELADLPDSVQDGRSVVDGGPFDGVSLRDLRSAHRDQLLGVTTTAPDGSFPLLVKYLDADENLSVQVHPDAAFARSHPGAHLKTEAWVVLEARPGARVYRGFRSGVTPADFERALAAGTVVELLETLEVSRGDCVYLPGGTCHAIGAGIVVAEIQTPSDTTYRVWDWNRNDPSRALHLDEARACMHFGARDPDGVPGFVRGSDAPSLEAGGFRTHRLCRSPFFRIEWLEATRAVSFPFEPSGVAEIWMTVSGTARWHSASGNIDAPAGRTVLRPAAVEHGEIALTAGTVLLRTTCASPLDRAM